MRQLNHTLPSSDASSYERAKSSCKVSLKPGTMQEYQRKARKCIKAVLESVIASTSHLQAIFLNTCPDGQLATKRKMTDSLSCQC